MTDLKALRAKANSLLTEYRHAARSAREERKALATASQRTQDATTAQKLVQELAANVQASVHGRMAGVVGHCLSAVFGAVSYGFKLNFEQKRGKTDAYPVFTRNGNELDPKSASGIGVVDIASVALRTVSLSQSRPPVRRLLCLDEPFRCLSSNHNEAAGQLIESLAREGGFQFLIITHNEALQLGKVIKL